MAWLDGESIALHGWLSRKKGLNQGIANKNYNLEGEAVIRSLQYMGDKVLQLNYAGFWLFVCSIYMALLSGKSAPIHLAPEPRKEVVSIYNDKFTTPKSRFPYFIEVFRCVEAEFNPTSNRANDKYPVNNTLSEIEIVVPDLTNDKRDPSRNKFYKYIVYNHTSCKYGDYAGRNFSNTPANNRVSKEYFKKRYDNNPKNLWGQIDLCKPQIRYKLSEYHRAASSKDKYLEYKQCLPGCVVKELKSKVKFVESGDEERREENIVSDFKCEAYDNKIANGKI